MKDKENYVKIPRQKLNFYHQIRVGEDIRKLIKLVNYLQKWGHKWQETHS